MKKRTEGKVKNCIGIQEIYTEYKENTESPVSYILFTKYLKECNKELVNIIINKAEKVALPYKLGNIHVAKFDRNWPEDKRKWAVDFKKTNELGFAVYHEQDYLYKWRWEKPYNVIKNKNKFRFQACRAAKRRVSAALKKNLDFFKI